MTRSDESKEQLSVTPLSSRAYGPYTVLFEAYEGKVCLSAFGKTVLYDTGVKDLTYHLIQLNFLKGNGPVVAIDDVKVWEALLKDEEPEKDKKKK